mmetsp:Transcript_40620/g.77576  ORF Transcript_40620/g.77576 Transcript_40620/m.77576 type:complete len:202 (-) Transcript_40620:93-698(-)
MSPGVVVPEAGGQNVQGPAVEGLHALHRGARHRHRCLRALGVQHKQRHQQRAEHLRLNQARLLGLRGGLGGGVASNRLQQHGGERGARRQGLLQEGVKHGGGELAAQRHRQPQQSRRQVRLLAGHCLLHQRHAPAQCRRHVCLLLLLLLLLLFVLIHFCRLLLAVHVTHLSIRHGSRAGCVRISETSRNRYAGTVDCKEPC